MLQYLAFFYFFILAILEITNDTEYLFTYLLAISVLFFFFFFATPVAYESSRARDQIQVAAVTQATAMAKLDP